MSHPVAKTIPPLDPKLYAIDAESSTFFKRITGIHDDDELREHILSVQAQAYAVAPYPCIRSFNFTRPKISMAPAYKDVLKLGQEREEALLLDIGCCFGNDARKATLDGFPAKQIITSDLRQSLWDLGHVLFRSNPKSFPATFLAGDALDPAFLSPFRSETEPSTGITNVDLSKISTLNDLHGKVSAIWVASFFHLFSEKDQLQLAHSLGSLLSPESGSILFGLQIALPNKGILVDKISDKEVRMFCHDVESWKEMWVGQPVVAGSAADNEGNFDTAVFAPDSVKLDSMLKPVKSYTGEMFWCLVWSITRI